MPGPNSDPYASAGGRAYGGKTVVRRARIKSGEGMPWSAEYRRRETRGAELAKMLAEKRARHVKRR